MSNVPDYYAILQIPTNASHDDIREGIKTWIDFDCQAFVNQNTL